MMACGSVKGEIALIEYQREGGALLGHIALPTLRAKQRYINAHSTFCKWTCVRCHVADVRMLLLCVYVCGMCCVYMCVCVSVLPQCSRCVGFAVITTCYSPLPTRDSRCSSTLTHTHVITYCNTNPHTTSTRCHHTTRTPHPYHRHHRHHTHRLHHHHHYPTHSPSFTTTLISAQTSHPCTYHATIVR